MDKQKLIKVWLDEGLSQDEIERRLDSLDESSDDVKPTLQEIQDRNIATVSAVNDKVEINSLNLATKKNEADYNTEIAALETRLKAYADALFSETITLNFDDGSNEDIKAGK